MSCVILIFFEVGFCCPSLLSNLALRSHITEFRLNAVLHFSLPVSYALCVTVGSILDVKVTSQRTALTLAGSTTTGDTTGLGVVLHLQVVRCDRLSQSLVGRGLALVFNSPAVSHGIECESRHAGITQRFDLNLMLTGGRVDSFKLADVTVITSDYVNLGIFQSSDKFFLGSRNNTSVDPGILLTILCCLFDSHSSFPPEAVVVSHEGTLWVYCIQGICSRGLLSRSALDRIVSRQIEVQIFADSLITQRSDVVDHAWFFGDNLDLQAALFCVIQNVSQHCREMRHPVTKGLNTKATVTVQRSNVTVLNA